MSADQDRQGRVRVRTHDPAASARTFPNRTSPWLRRASPRPAPGTSTALQPAEDTRRSVAVRWPLPSRPERLRCRSEHPRLPRPPEGDVIYLISHYISLFFFGLNVYKVSFFVKFQLIDQKRSKNWVFESNFSVFRSKYQKKIQFFVKFELIEDPKLGF